MVLVVKNPPANAGDIRDVDSIPATGKSPGGGPGNPLQYSCLENPMDREAWKAVVHTVTKSWTRLREVSTQHGKAEIPRVVKKPKQKPCSNKFNIDSKNGPYKKSF